MYNEESNQDFNMETLPFVNLEIVRLMKMNLDDDKMIRQRVKDEMNKFLYHILQEVCFEINKYPYPIIEYEMLEEAIYPYTNVKKINEEKVKILAYLDAIIADCEVLSAYVKETLNLHDFEEEEEFIPLTGRVKAIKKISRRQTF